MLKGGWEWGVAEEGAGGFDERVRDVTSALDKELVSQYTISQCFGWW